MKMNSILNKVMIFAAGVVVGSAVTCKVLTSKYEQQVREDVESVKREFSKMYQDDSRDEVTKPEESSDDEDEEDESEIERKVYSSIINKNNYANYSNNTEKEDDDDMEKPYVIPPEEFGECEYAEVSLTYYQDGVVLNDRNKIVSNTDELIGPDFASHFGEYEDDSVFVRNDRIRTDFEILKVLERYFED